MKKLAKEKGTDLKKRTRGRPKKAITRSVSLVVRLTPTERLAIEGRAKSAGMVVSEWFRKAARTAVIIPRLSNEESSHYLNLSGNTNHLDPLNKFEHIDGICLILTDLRRLLGEVERLMERIGKDDS